MFRSRSPGQELRSDHHNSLLIPASFKGYSNHEEDANQSLPVFSGTFRYLIMSSIFGKSILIEIKVNENHVCLKTSK